MILEIIIALLCGVISGTLTGLAPGIHINLVAAFLISSLSFFAGVPPIALAVFIVSMSITHIFIDFIPSILLGAPEDDTFLAILPGHHMLLEGNGYEAIILALYGALFSIPIILIFSPLFILFLPSFYSLIKSLIPFILIFISAYLIFREKNYFLSFLVFSLSAFLGLAVFSLPIKDPLLPMLSGLFGLSSLFASIKNKTSLPTQKIISIRNILLTKKELIRSLFASFISAPLCSILPGIGSGHAAVIGSEIVPQKNRTFLFLVGNIASVVMALSFVTAYSIGKTRSGSAVAVQQLLQSISFNHIIIILIAILLSAIISFILGIYISRAFIFYFNKINYKYLTIIIILLIITINIIFSNWLGLIVLFISTFVGLFCISSGSRRINLMGCLIVPAIIYYLT